MSSIFIKSRRIGMTWYGGLEAGANTTTAATPEALRAAWERMRLRPAMHGWPPSFDQVMADPLRSRVVRLEATHGRPATTAPCHPARPPPPPLRPAQPPRFDHKRAASGERDDD
nr:hypothetical protein [uncultured Albidiferax sp.]